MPSVKTILADLGYDLPQRTYSLNRLDKGGSHATKTHLLKVELNTIGSQKTGRPEKSSVVLKIFFTASSVVSPDVNVEHWRNELTTDNDALIYERKIYQQVSGIPELSDNIIRFVAYEELDLPFLSLYQERNSLLALWQDLFTPEVGFGETLNKKLTAPELYKLNITVTDYTKGLPLRNFLGSNLHYIDEDLIPILFQIIWGIQVLQKNHIQHNDMHQGNVYIVEHPVSTLNREYTTNDGQLFILPKTAPNVLFFDWDFANTPFMPGPKATADWACYKYGICGILNERRDIYRSLFEFVSNSLKTPVGPKVKQFLQKVLNAPPGKQKLDYVTGLDGRKNKGYPCNVDPGDPTRCDPYLPDEPKQIMDSTELLREDIFKIYKKKQDNPLNLQMADYVRGPVTRSKVKTTLI